MFNIDNIHPYWFWIPSILAWIHLVFYRQILGFANKKSKKDDKSEKQEYVYVIKDTCEHVFLRGGTISESEYKYIMEEGSYTCQVHNCWTYSYGLKRYHYGICTNRVYEKDVEKRKKSNEDEK